MSGGIAAIQARVAQLDRVLAGLDPGGASSGTMALALWPGGSFGSVMSATGAAASATAAASSTSPQDVAGVASVPATDATGPAGSSPSTGAAAPALSTADGTDPIAVLASGGAALSSTGAAISAAGPAGTPGGPLFPLAVAPARSVAVASASPSEASASLEPRPASSTAWQAAVTGTGGLAFRDPVAGGRLTQAFGPTGLSLEPSGVVDGVRYRHVHEGIDLAAAEGTPVTAAADGVVILAGRVQDGAVDVIVRHAGGVETLYGHLEPSLAVHVGQKVRAGTVLGRVGMTGNTTGPHLHFALTRGGVPMDPSPYLESGHLPGLGGPPGTGIVASAGGTTHDGTPDTLADAFAAFDKVAAQIPYAADIRDAATRAGIPPLLLAALVKYESGFRADATSSAGAMGLTQLMPVTARSLGVTDPYDPVQNLRAGARYIASNLRLYGRADFALAAYQAGRGTVRAAGGMPQSTTTRHYVAGIINTWGHWTRMGSK